MTLSGTNAIASELQAALPPESIETAAAPALGSQLAQACTNLPEPLTVVAPRTTAELAKAIALAHQQQWRSLVIGGGSKLGWGQPAPHIDLGVTTRHLDRCIDYAVADMTVTVEAGMTLAALQAKLGQQRQWLPIDPAYPETATLGGIVATRDTGSLRHRYGGLRDLLLGLTCVRSDGEVAKAGGRVVKNVAGYDLMKLFTGSFGTLGILTELTFRVYPIPEQSGTVLLHGPGEAIGAIAQQIQSSTLTPTVHDLRVGLDTPSQPEHLTLILRFQSLAAGVAAQVEQIQAWAIAQPVQIEVLRDAAEHQWWQAQSQALWQRVEGRVLCKIGGLPAHATALLSQMQQTSSTLGLQLQGRIHRGSGLGQIWLQGDPAVLVQGVTRLRQHCEQAGGFLSILEAPIAVKNQLEVWGYQGNALSAMQILKHKFDPQHILNPGRFVGGL